MNTIRIAVNRARSLLGGKAVNQISRRVGLALIEEAIRAYPAWMTPGAREAYEVMSRGAKIRFVSVNDRAPVTTWCIDRLVMHVSDSRPSPEYMVQYSQVLRHLPIGTEEAMFLDALRLSPPGTLPHVPEAVEVVREARGVGDYRLLPVAADMLQEAGCEDEALLRHLRSGQPHYPFCWACNAIEKEQLCPPRNS